MVLVSDDGKTTWIVENPATLINQAGQHVLINARPGKHVNSIRILRLRPLGYYGSIPSAATGLPRRAGFQ
jgi:hypothetical protein